MVTLATIVAGAALLGAVVSWVLGAINFVRTLQATDRSLRWFALVAWPFAARKMTGEAAVHSAKVNKAIVAFIVCVMIAITAISLATNLSRLAR